MTSDLIQQQIDYYRARAGEYDDWWHRRGRYDRGPEFNKRWFAEAAQVREALLKFGTFNEVLELACGTGIWTEELLKISRRITAIDASPEVIEINRQRLRAPNISYAQADLFTWKPDQEYDLVFFGFWLSHVPPERLDAFLDTVRRAVRPGGRLFLVDSLYEATSTAKDHALQDQERHWQARKLNDGREFKVVKIFYEAKALQEKLLQSGFAATVTNSGSYFLFAQGARR
jgi:ubiquinone/menaquinone biosynthesis C-methylase UbiE